ncbi:hypothetical protein L1887_00932 [Cichorium endivia]|nr:hypothetical protein L1887_00932 [Cichorium endivia]
MIVTSSPKPPGNYIRRTVIVFPLPLLTANLRSISFFLFPLLSFPLIQCSDGIKFWKLASCSRGDSGSGFIAR